MDHQDSYGCLGRSNGRDLQPLSRKPPRRSFGKGPPSQARTGRGSGLPAHGQGYESNETRQLVLDLGYEPVVPPKSCRSEPWEYDRGLYKRRNEIERLFRRLKGFRRIFSRFDKLDALFRGFICFALVVESLR